MRIGLVDVDGHHYPNLALMKLSAFHKSVGDTVEWATPLFGNYDRVYMSKVHVKSIFNPKDMKTFKNELRHHYVPLHLQQSKNVPQMANVPTIYKR